jgi:hypothetical protein
MILNLAVLLPPIHGEATILLITVSVSMKKLNKAAPKKVKVYMVLTWLPP